MVSLIERTSNVRLSTVAIPALGCLLAASGCGVDDQTHQATLRDLQHQKQIAWDRGAYIKAKDQQIDLLNRRVEQLESEQKGSEEALSEAQKSREDTRRSRVRAEARATQFRQLVSQFRKMIETGKLVVEIRDHRMIVRVDDQMLFDPGKSQLTKEGADTLQQVTKVLKDVDKRHFQVAGHTDNSPIRSARFRSNWDLSAAHAVEVVRFMIASGMEPHRLSAAGYSDQDPVARNDQPDGRTKNRRIEITLTPTPEDLPPIGDNAASVRTGGDGGPAATTNAVPSGSAPATRSTLAPSNDTARPVTTQ